MDKQSNILKYLEFFDNPHIYEKFIHIAGTKGKTSTAYYIYDLLFSAGESVGLFISPHVFTEQERIQRNGDYISQNDLTLYRGKIQKAKDSLSLSLNFFEEWLLIAFLYFRDQPVSYIVLEVGIGGKYDSTNVVLSSIAVITRIDKDHQEVLGHTLWEMFTQKLGIIKNKAAYLLGKQRKLGKVYALLRSLCLFSCKRIPLFPSRILSVNGLHVDVRIGSKNYELHGPLYMVDNFALAVSLIEFLGYSTPNIFFHRVPGRLQYSSEWNYILDGAHNFVASQALVQSLNKQFPETLWVIILCIAKDKDIPQVIHNLERLHQPLYMVLPWDQYLGDRYQVDFLLRKLKPSVADRFVYMETESDMVKEIKKYKERKILVTGSFYHLFLVRKWLEG